MAIAVRSGPAHVVASGEATCFAGNSLVLDIDAPVGLTVELAFEQREGLEDVAVELTTFGTTIRFLLVNFDGADGRGTSAPALLGEVGEQLLFLHFRVWKWGETLDRTVHYTLFQVAKDDVDWQSTQG